MAFFLVPFLVCNIARFGSEEQKQTLIEEFDLVLCEGDEKAKEDENDGLFNLISANTTSSLTESSQMCIQCVFHIIDWLRRWVEKQRQNVLLLQNQLKNGTSVYSKTEIYKRIENVTKNGVLIEQFVNKIPTKHMVKASRRCKAFARALFNLEFLLRDNCLVSKTNVDVDDIISTDNTFLNTRSRVVVYRDTYSYLGEPDGLSGVWIDSLAGRKHPNILIADQIQSGKLVEALTVLDVEIAKQKHKTNVGLRSNRLKCFRKLGNLETAVSLAIGEIVELNNLDLEKSVNKTNITQSNPPLTKSSSNLDKSASAPLRFTNTNVGNSSLQEKPQTSDSQSMVSFSSTHVKSQTESPYVLLMERGIQSAWRLADWTSVTFFEKQMTGQQSNLSALSWDTNVGRVLSQIYQCDTQSALEMIQEMRSSVSLLLSAASLESYNRCYPYMLKLHLLYEIEQIVHLFEKVVSMSFSSTSDNVSHGVKNSLDNQQIAILSSLMQSENILQQWEVRFNATQNTFKTVNAISTLERVLLLLCGKESESASRWRVCTKSARKIGQFQMAHHALHHAKLFDVDGTFFEEAKLEWAEGKHESALDLLNLGIIELKNSNPGVDSSSALLLSKALLRKLSWEEANDNVDQEVFKETFERVIKSCPHWESAYFFFGHFNDKLFLNSKLSDLDKPETFDYLLSAIDNYLHSLTFGHTFLFQSLPRSIMLLSIVGTEKSLQPCLEKVQNKFLGYLSKTPTYTWLCVISHLTGRLMHKNKNVANTITQAIKRIVKQFPEQACWSLLLFYNQGNAFQDFQNQINQSKNTSFSQCVLFAHALIEICDFNAEHLRRLFVNKNFPQLSQFPYTSVIVPQQKNLVPVLPKHRGESYLPFPYTPPTIVGIDNSIEVMHSLAKPRKIKLMCSDGTSCFFLCKPMDDIRRDNRVLEFFSVMNKLFDRDPECRRRALGVVTFTAIPLRERAGLIEWVANTSTIRTIVLQQKGNDGNKAMEEARKAFKEHNFRPSDANFKLSAKLSCYRNAKKAFGPPVLWKFFVENFSEPSMWFESRLNFTRSTAVMCMIGYCIGLGDRHLENLLVRTTDGKVVHVDFSCIFWQGKSLPIPELVPYRLTPTLVDAFGLTGTSGVFTGVAELTLGVLQKNRETLVSVLESFLNDTNIEWISSAQSAKSSTSASTFNTKSSLDQFNSITSGIPKNGFRLSVSAQVRQTINCATDESILCRMFEGWCPWV